MPMENLNKVGEALDSIEEHDLDYQEKATLVKHLIDDLKKQYSNDLNEVTSK